MPIDVQSLTIPAKGVRSLVWENETLVDWVRGGARFGLNGSVTPRAVNYAYDFDAACSSPSGEYAILYTRLGTKGLVLRRGEVCREINRSFYHADAYEFPVTIARLASGREVLVHCPDEYNLLEIDDISTGERLTAHVSRKPADFFHSRLAANSNGTTLISAGWVWHPFDSLAAYDLEQVLADPTRLDGLGVLGQLSTEISSAAFLANGRVVFSTSEETFVEEPELSDPKTIRPSSLVVFDLENGELISQVAILEPAGTLMPLDGRHVVGFFNHPKVFDLTTGGIVFRLDDLSTGEQTSSIIHHMRALPPLAIDPTHRRFAVATESEIRVVEFHGWSAAERSTPPRANVS